MNRAIFRVLCVTHLLLVIFTAYAVATNYNLPPELVAYAKRLSVFGSGFTEEALVFLSFATLAANIGLLFFYNWARIIFCIGIVSTTGGMAFIEPVVKSSLGTSASELGMVLSGFLISLTYFSSISYEFSASNS